MTMHERIFKLGQFIYLCKQHMKYVTHTEGGRTDTSHHARLANKVQH